jgi:CelD/BcsL family acetyltransferase involved in cellulose biosynthesis
MELHAASLESLQDEWVRLGTMSGNIFSTWEWASLWWRHFGQGKRALTAVVHTPGGEAVAILPLYCRFERPVKLARFVGHGAGDELCPICARGEERAFPALLASAQHPELGWDVLLAERLPDASGRPEALGGRVLLRESSPVVDLEGRSWDDYLATRSSNFRAQLRRKERKLVREHGLTYRLSDEPDRLQDDMSTLFSLHAARWGEETSGALEGARVAFHRDFASVAQQRGWLRLWLAEVEGRAAAAWYGFRFGGADWYYQFGRNPAWERASIGLVLLAHTVREAANDGQRQYRLLRGGEAFKDRFATGDPGLVTAAVARGARGRLAVAAASAGLALPAPLRSRVIRAVG